MIDKDKLTPLPSLVRDKKGVEIGYNLEALKVWLKKNKLLEKFSEWYEGQTGGIIRGMYVVYKYDVDRFLDGDSPMVY